MTFASSVFAQMTWAFPEMARHGYTNCTACHISTTGGGVLTPYGRELSKEVLSTWSREGEQEFAYNLVRPPDWLTLGADFRSLQQYMDTSTATSAKFIYMQGDLEAAATYKKWVLYATFGISGDSNNGTTSGTPISRDHYLLYRATDELNVRAGRFQYAYGINLADHEISTKGGLGINDEGSETYNVEASWIGENYNFYLTGITGRFDDRAMNLDAGISAVASAAIAGTYKTGLSYLYASNSTRTRDVFGPFGILGFTPHFFLLSEFDFQNIHPSATSPNSQWGMADYQRLDYEFFQGFHVFLTQELKRLDFKQSSSLAKTYGIGIQFFPRPHFEITTELEMQIQAGSPGYTDFDFLLMHFYL